MNVITPYIYFAFCGAALFSAILLFFNRQKNPASMIFAVLLILFAIDTGLNAFIILKGYRSYPHLLGLSRPFIFLYGPLFYIAYSYLTANIIKVKSDQFLHFLPFLVYSFLMIPFIFKSGATKIFLYENYVKGVVYIEYSPHFMMFFKVLFFMIYSIIPLFLITKFKKTVVTFYSTVDTVKLLKLQIIAACYFGCSLILAYYLYGYINGPDFLRPDIPQTFFYPLAFVFFLTSFFALTDSSFFKCTVSTADLRFEMEELQEIQEVEEPETDKKYYKNKIPDDVAEKSLADLKEVMDLKKPFTDSNLTLVDLARIIHIKPYHLSQLINSRLGENFYVFINTARVKYAAQIMQDTANSQKSILEIAYKSGFNSKSAFNTYFKNIFHETPSQFKKKRL
ncbi:MAG TPA: helix-turn-helix domain-containing protein [bacterium]|nr:helix-turn-helix domain-containing protein [bacterium]HPS28955.1 helix-turn-helix domain-containing protein [bacterium]